MFRKVIYSTITVLTAEMAENRHLANSGYTRTRAPVLGPNEFYINTKRFRKDIYSTIPALTAEMAENRRLANSGYK
jgi:hypothetical protein